MAFNGQILFPYMWLKILAMMNGNKRPKRPGPKVPVGARKKADSITASFGSLFVFDTCKPSALKAAFEDAAQHFTDDSVFVEVPTSSTTPDDEFDDDDAVAAPFAFGVVGFKPRTPPPSQQLPPTPPPPSRPTSISDANVFDEFTPFSTFNSQSDVEKSSSSDSVNISSEPKTESEVVEQSSAHLQAIDEFKYAEEQLDAIIDLLEEDHVAVATSQLVEDEKGRTDWIAEEGFSTFEFAPEWLEMTLTMKPNGNGSATRSTSGTSGVESIFGESSGFNGIFGGPSNAVSSSSPSNLKSSGEIQANGRSATATEPMDEVESLFAKQRHSTIHPTPSPPSSSNSSPTISSSFVNAKSTSSTNGKSTTSPVVLPPSAPLRILPPSSSSPALLPTNAKQPVSPTPQATTAATFLLPSALPPAKLTSSGPASAKPPLTSSSPLLLPSPLSLKPPTNSPPMTRKNSLPMPPAALAPPPLGAVSKASSFITPLTSSPGLGETTMVIYSVIYQLRRILDPCSPFESIVHDPTALDLTKPVIVLKEAIEMPPSAGSNISSSQEPPTFNTNIMIVSSSDENGLDTLIGIGNNASAFMDSWRTAKQAEQLAKSGSPSVASNTGGSTTRPLPSGAPLVVSKARPSPNPQVIEADKEAAPSFCFNCVDSSSSSFTEYRHVLISTMAIVNPQGKTKRIIKLVALEMSMSKTLVLDDSLLPGLPLNNFSNNPSSIRSPTTLTIQTNPRITTMIHGVASSHGAIMVMPPRPSNTALSQSFVDYTSSTLNLYQKLNYYSGPVRGNPHIRLLAVSSSSLSLTSTSLTSSSEQIVLDPTIASHYSQVISSSMSWAQGQSIGLILTRSSSDWLPILTSSSKTSPPPSWFLHPLIFHIAAQVHVLRMEALMNAFDKTLKSTSSNDNNGSNNVSNGSSNSSTNSNNVKASSTNVNHPSSPKKPSPASLQQLSRKASFKFQSNPSSPLSNPSYSKRIVAVIGLKGCGKSSFIKRACHSRSSRLLSMADQSVMTSMTSTMMMSTLSPMTMMMTTLSNSSSISPSSNSSSNSSPNSSSNQSSSSSIPNHQLSSSFADVYFGTNRCLVEFIETPSRLTNKVQFYNVVNRAHAFVFVYSGVHPSPAEVQEIALSLDDISKSKSFSSSSSNLNNNISKLMFMQSLRKTQPSTAQPSPSNPHTGQSSSSSPPSPQDSASSPHSILEQIPIIVIGTQAPSASQEKVSLDSEGNVVVLTSSNQAQSSSSLVAKDPSLSSSSNSISSIMSLTQLLERYNSILHFHVDSSPIHHSELGKALQWLYNRIGEDTLQLKGVKATNRPHHSGSISIVPPSHSSAHSKGNSSKNIGVTTIQGQQSSSQSSSNLRQSQQGKSSSSSSTGSPPLSHATSAPSSIRRDNFKIGNGSSAPPKTTSTQPAHGQNRFSVSYASSPAQSTPALTKSSSLNSTTTPVPLQTQKSSISSQQASVALFLKLESLVLRMRGASKSSASSIVTICDRKMENGVWVPLAAGESVATLGSSYYIVDDDIGGVGGNSSGSSGSNQSNPSKKKKILAKSFVGSEAVDWMVENVIKPEFKQTQSTLSTQLISVSQMRSDANNQLSELLDLGVLRCVYGGSDTSSKFLDSPNAFYRFQMDEDNESILNMRKVWIGEVDHVEIEQLAMWLFTKIQPFITRTSNVNSGDINGQANVNTTSPPNISSSSSSSIPSSSSHFQIDSHGFLQSGLLNDLLLFSAKLQKISLKPLSHCQKVAFWINVYNILAIHVNIQHGNPGKSKNRRKLVFDKTFYQIDGHPFSLDDILHGVLRGNRKNPTTGKSQFKPTDRRMQFVLHSDSSSLMTPNIYSSGAPSSTANNRNGNMSNLASPGSTVGTFSSSSNLAVSASTQSTQSSTNLPPFDPRIHFALTTMTALSPFIAPLSGNVSHLDIQLDTLSKAYLSSEVEVNFKSSYITLPALIHTYRNDFGLKTVPQQSFWPFLCRFVSPDSAKTINFLATKIKEKDIKSKSEDVIPAAPRFFRS